MTTTKKDMEDQAAADARLARLVATFEPLHPDLRKHLKGGVLHHPFCIFHGLTKQLYALFNCQYLERKQRVDEALRTKQWMEYIFGHERPYRLDAFYEAFADGHGKFGVEISDEEYWRILRNIYIDSENLWQQLHHLFPLLTSNRPQRSAFMTTEDVAFLNRQPDPLTIYRGCIRGQNTDGWSWTLNKKQALWFAKRSALMSHGVSMLVKGNVEKCHVIAYIADRGESEIVVNPASVKVVSRDEIPPEKNR